MELSFQNNLRGEKWLTKIGIGLFCLVILVSFALGVGLVSGQSTLVKEKPIFPTTSPAMLGQGPLALTNPVATELQPLLQELILIGANTRPDHDRACSIALRSSGQKKTLSVGESVFFETREGKLVFSDESTDLVMTARSIENHQLVCEIKNHNAPTICTLNASTIFSNTLQQESYLDSLKKGALWGKDVFLSDWGGDEYRAMTSKVKISLGPDVFFLKPGDCLWWDGTAWISHIQSDSTCPVAQFVKASSSGADFQVWDSSGFSCQAVHVEPQTPSKASPKLDELITAIRPRSPSEITCQLGKRRVIVREGDWWIRMEDRWRPIRTATDLEACLIHQIPGELFIFEKVETSRGKVLLKGLAFDRMRTASEPISLVLQTEKKAPTAAGKASMGSPPLAKNKSRPPTISHSAEGL
jgi:hypothetical protein